MTTLVGGSAALNRAWARYESGRGLARPDLYPRAQYRAMKEEFVRGWFAAQHLHLVAVVTFGDNETPAIFRVEPLKAEYRKCI